MTAKELMQSLLQAAVQGKLVAQDPQDEPASKLLERIMEEKKQLIKAKKIKAPKQESIIYRKEDGSVYELRGKEEKCIDNEIPYDIPESWEWVRLGSVITLISGQDLSPDKYNSSSQGIPYITGASNIQNKKVIVNRWTDFARSKAYCGDLLLTCKGTIGSMAILEESVVHIARQIMAISTYCSLSLSYLSYFIDSVVVFLKSVAKSMIPGISRDNLLGMMFPLPPLSEQKRIVEKIEELKPLIDKYDCTYTALDALDKSYPKLMKQSLLQAAIQGKLVPQNPDDEPASKLLEKIQAEKQALIKAGKLKPSKFESTIYQKDDGSYYERIGKIETCIDSEIPFQIPKNWAWARLGSVSEYIQRGKSPKYSSVMKYPVIAQKCNQWTGFSIEKAKFIEPDSLSSYTEDRILKDNDLLWNSTGLGTVGRMAIYKSDANPYELAVADGHVTVIRLMHSFISHQFIYNYIASPVVQSVIEGQTSGSTKQKELNLSTVISYLVPIPPMEAQKQIIEKVKVLEQLL